MNRYAAGRRRVVPIVIAALVGAAILVTGVSLATAQGEHDHSDVDHHHGFTASGDEANWPPRPTGANSELSPVALPADAPLAGALAAPEELAPALIEALGQDWLHISSAPAKSGKGGTLAAEETYFSRDLNQTVIARKLANGVEVLTFAPDELQPIISPPERATAAELGREWLIDQGFAAVAQLDGFGIRAFDDGELYPVRMVYVTYATSGFADPDFSALVDLTNQVVVTGGAL